MKTTYTCPRSLSLRLRTEGMMAASLSVGGTTSSGTEEIVETEGGVLSNERSSFDTHYWDGAEE